MVSSYQTLARYHDLDRLPNRMSSIRQQMRDDLDTSRTETRMMQRFHQRGIHDISSEAEEEDDCDYYEDYSESHLYGYDDVDHYSIFPSSHPLQHDQQMHQFNGLPTTPPPSNAPSPSLSSDSHCSNGWGGASYSGSPARKPRPTGRSRKEILRLRKRVQMNTYHPEEIERRYQTLKMHILERLDDTTSVSRLICASWNVLGDAMDHPDDRVMRDAANFLTELVYRRYISVADVLFMLQQGLILQLRKTISRPASLQTDCIALLDCVIRVEPRAAPYLTELMLGSGLLSSLEDLIVLGADEEVNLFMKFYHDLFAISSEQLARGRFVPLVPDNLAATTTSQELERLYNPLTALKHIVSPRFINQMMNKFFGQTGITSSATYESLTRVALIVFANSLQLAKSHMDSASKEWASNVFQTFEDWNLDQIIVKHQQSRLSRVLRDEMSSFLEFYQDVRMAVSRSLT